MDSLGSRDYSLRRKQLPGSTSLRKRLQRESGIVRNKMTSTSEDMLECGGGDASTLPLLSRRSPTPEEEEEGTFDAQNADDHVSDSGIENEVGEPPLVVPASPSARDKDAQVPEQKERLRTVALQIFLPFMMAGLGCVFAGMLLDHVEVGTLCVCVWGGGGSVVGCVGGGGGGYMYE